MNTKEIQDQIDKLRIVYLPDPEDADYLDAVLRQGADTMEALLKENERLKTRYKKLAEALSYEKDGRTIDVAARIELLEKVVEAAKCPNNCMAGAVLMDPGSTAATIKVCQWCTDRIAALKEQT